MARQTRLAATLSLVLIVLIAVMIFAASIASAQAGAGSLAPRYPIPDPPQASTGAAGLEAAQGPGLAASVDLAVSKAYLGPKSEPGRDITFRVYYSNTTAVGTAGQVTIIDTLPVGSSYVGTSGATPISVNYTGGQATISYNVGNLVANAHGFFDIDTFISQTTPINSWLTNTVTIIAGVGDTDPNPANNVASASTMVVGAELSIAKTAPSTVTAGDTMQYRIDVHNSGNQSARNVVITDRLPSGVTFIPPSSPPHTAYANGVITWSTGITVGTGSTYTISFAATAPYSASGTILTNTAGTSNNTVNENDYNNNITSTTTVITGTPDLQISKSDGGIIAQAGGLITYTIFYTNAGSGAAFDAVLTESVPANTTYAGGPAWTFVSGNVYTASLGTIPATPCCKYGQIQFVVRVDSVIPPNVNFITNTVVIGDAGLNGPDPTPANNTATILTPVTGTVDLRVTKRDLGTVVQAGDLLTYTVSYTNTGSKGATGVLITDILPANTTYVAGGWTPVNGVYVKSIGPLAGGGFGQSTPLVVRVNNSVPATLTEVCNTAIIDYDLGLGADPTPSNNTSTICTSITAAPDLVVTKNDNVSTFASPGETINYTISYTNTGSKPATNVVLTDTVPQFTTFVGPNTWHQIGATSDFTVAVGTVNPGSGGTATISAIVAGSIPAGVVILTDTVRIGDDGAQGADLNPANNVYEEHTPLIALPDLSVSKTDNGAYAVPGQTLAYQITFSNVGARTSSGIVLTETVPANATFNPGASTSGWTCSPNNSSGSSCWFAVGSLNAGQSGSAVVFAVTINTPFPSGVYFITNTVRIADSGVNGPDPNAYNNTSTRVTPVNATPDMVVTKTDGSLSTAAGNALVYTVFYTNAGNKTATGVALLDTIPQYTTYVGYGWTPMGGGQFMRPIGTVLPGASGSITIALQVASTVPASAHYITNTVTIFDDLSNGADPTPSNNTAIDVDILNANPDLRVFKSHSVGSAQPGDTINFTISYDNVGQRDATGVMLTEILPANTTFSGSGWTLVAGNIYTRSVGTLAVNGAGSASFTVQVNPTVPAGTRAITNTVAIIDDGNGGVDLNPANNTAVDVVPLFASVDLEVFKTDGVTTISAGQTTTYTIYYTNTGTIGASGVILTENLPFFVTPGGGWAAVGGNVYTKSVGILGPGASGTAQFIVHVPTTIPAGITALTNTVTISDDNASGSDGDTTDNTSTDIDTLLAVPDMAITKTDGGQTAVAGGLITYTIFYSNVGTQGALNVRITDTLPSYVAYVNGGWTAAGNNMFVKTLSSVPVGSGGAISMVVQVTNTVPAGVDMITNTVTIGDDGSQGADPDLTNNTAVETTPLLAAPELIISKSDGITSTVPGQFLIYTIFYTNTGTQEATGIVLTDTKPAEATCVAPGCTPWSLVAGDVYTRSVPSLPAGQSTSVIFVVQMPVTVPAGLNAITNAACINDDGSNGPESNPFNNCALDTDTVNASPDLVISKTDGGASSEPGKNITYTITYSNTGNQTATGVVITDYLSTNVTYVNGGWTPAFGGYVQSVGDLPVGASGTVTIVVRVNNALPAGTTSVSNTVVIRDDGSNGPDLSLPDNTAVEYTPVSAAPDLMIVKTESPSPVAPGQLMTYTITFSNSGSIPVSGVVVTEVVPANTTFVGPAGWALVGGVRRWNVGGTIPVGSGGSLTFIVQVNSTVAAGTDNITNTVTIGDDGLFGADLNPLDNTFTLLTPLNAAPDLRLTKNDNTSSVSFGGRITYTISYTNSGNQGATGVVLTDILPANTRFVGPGWVQVGGTPTYTYSLPALAANASGTVQFIVDVSDTLPAGFMQVCNSASIGDDGLNGAESNTANNTATECTPVNAWPELQVAKSDGGVTATTGQQITYTITYTNAGHRGATGVVLTETLPANTSYAGGGWTVAGGNTFTMSIGTLEALTGTNTATALFVVQAAAVMPSGVEAVTNTVRISDNGANGVDPIAANNVATDTTPINAVPDLVVTKSDGGIIANPGDIVNYTISFTNTGNQDAANVVLTETLPANSTYFPSGWTLVSGSTYIRNMGSLIAGNSGSVPFMVMVTTNMPAGQNSITNTVSIGYDGAGGADPTPGNNTATDSTPVMASPNLVVTKSNGTAVSARQHNHVHHLLHQHRQQGLKRRGADRGCACQHCPHRQRLDLHRRQPVHQVAGRPWHPAHPGRPSSSSRSRPRCLPASPASPTR